MSQPELLPDPATQPVREGEPRRQVTIVPGEHTYGQFYTDYIPDRGKKTNDRIFDEKSGGEPEPASEVEPPVNINRNPGFGIDKEDGDPDQVKSFESLDNTAPETNIEMK